MRCRRLNYGPAHQGIAAVYLGEKQLLAHLCLPTVVASSQHEYVLHPSLADSALQASIGLIVDFNHLPGRPSVPSGLESVRVLSACTKEMFAWLRYSDDSKPGDRIVKLDIDLCDQPGNLCVEMRGLTLQVLEANTSSSRQTGSNHDCAYFDSAFYQKLVADIINREVSVDEAVELN